MKKMIFFLAMALLIVGATAYADLVTIVELNIVNDTGALVDKIEVAPEYAPNDWVEVPIRSWVIRSGETYRMQFREFGDYASDIFHIRLRDDQGRTYVRRDQDLVHTSTVRFTADNRN